MSHMMTIAGVHYHLAGGRLRIVQGADTVLDVSLSPVLDGKTARIDDWKKTGPNTQ